MFTTRRLGLRLTALLIATLLWLVVSARQPTEGMVRVRVVATLDSSLVLLEPPSTLEATVTGRVSDIAKLIAVPPTIHRRISGDSPDTLVLDVLPSEVRVPADVAGEVRIVDLQPRTLTLRFVTRASRRLPVASDGRVIVRTPTRVFAAESVSFEPKMVSVTGPRRVVQRLRTVHPFTLTIDEGDTVPHLANLDTTGQGIRLQPAQVRVRLLRP